MDIRGYQGTTPDIGARVYIDPRATVIGAVTLGDDASLWPGTVVRGDVNFIVVGARTNVQDGSILHVTHDGPYGPKGGLPLLIGTDVTVGHLCLLHACTIGQRVLVGMGSIVMDGAVLEDDVLLGAGALVSPGKRLERGHLYRGRPAEKVRRLTDAELEMLRYSAAHYVRLKDRYLTGS